MSTRAEGCGKFAFTLVDILNYEYNLMPEGQIKGCRAEEALI
jgi:hypothetical protein